MNKFISIPIEEFTLEQFETDSRIAKLSLKFMHDKVNLNKSSIDLSVIQDAVINSLNNTPTGIPILAAFEDDGSDFKEHNDEEVSIGCIPPINNNIHYEKDSTNDKTYAYIDGYIWRYYSKNAIDILEQAKDMTKSCSIEIEILKGHKDRKKGVYIIEEFKFLGVTLLGDKYPPGMEGANVKLEYSFEVSETYVNKLKELNEILNQCFNKTENNIETENVSEDININKNKEEYNKMTKKEIAEKFNLTYEQLEDEIRSELSECNFEGEDWYGDKCLMQRFYLMDYDDSFVYCYDYQNNIYVKIPYSKNNDDVEIDFTNSLRIKFSPVDWETGSSSEDDEVEEDFVKKFAQILKDKHNSKFTELNSKIETLKKENKKVTDKFVSLENTIADKNKVITEKETEFFTKSEELTAKDEIIANYEKDLGEFKAYKQEKVKQEVQSKVEALYSEYADFISDEDKTTFNEIVSKCEDFEQFKYEEFEAQVTKTIAPKMKAQLFALKQSNTNLDTNKIDISLMGLTPVNDIDKKASKSSMEQLEEYLQN
jgi:hypothetical protein